MNKCSCLEPQEICIPDNQTISHVSEEDGSWRNTPRIPPPPNVHNDEGEFSAYLGRVTSEQAKATFPKKKREQWSRRHMRYTTAGKLRESGFYVLHTPNENNPSSNHVSIVLPQSNGIFIAGCSPLLSTWGVAEQQSLCTCFGMAWVPQTPAQTNPFLQLVRK